MYVGDFRTLIQGSILYLEHSYRDLSYTQDRGHDEVVSSFRGGRGWKW